MTMGFDSGLTPMRSVGEDDDRAIERSTFTRRRRRRRRRYMRRTYRSSRETSMIQENSAFVLLA